MRTLDTWWSPAAQCWRVEDGELFTYYDLDLVVGHFVHRSLPATALLVAPPHSDKTAMLDRALRSAGIPIVYATE
jgi:hypothetical protein